MSAFLPIPTPNAHKQIIFVFPETVWKNFYIEIVRIETKL